MASEQIKLKAQENTLTMIHKRPDINDSPCCYYHKVVHEYVEKSNGNFKMVHQHFAP